MSRPSLRAAIDAMCKSCIYDPGCGNGAWREQVQGCSSSNCPLHPVRPMPVKAAKTINEAQERGSAIMPASDTGMPLDGERIGRNDLTAAERRAA